MNIGNWKDKIKIARNTRFRDDDTGVVTGTGSRGEGFYNITIKGSILNDVPTLDLDSGNPMGTLEKGMSAAIGFVDGQPFLFGYSPQTSSGTIKTLGYFLLPFRTPRGNVGRTRYVEGSTEEITPLNPAWQYTFQEFVAGEIPIFCNEKYFYTTKSRYYQKHYGLVKDKDWDNDFKPSEFSTFLDGEVIVRIYNGLIESWDCEREIYYSFTFDDNRIRELIQEYQPSEFRYDGVYVNGGYEDHYVRQTVTGVGMGESSFKFNYTSDKDNLLYFMLRYFQAPPGTQTKDEGEDPTANLVILFSFNYKGEIKKLKEWSNIYEPKEMTGGGAYSSRGVRDDNSIYNWNTAINYAKTFGKKHFFEDNIFALLGNKGSDLLKISVDYEHKIGVKWNLNTSYTTKAQVDTYYINYGGLEYYYNHSQYSGIGGIPYDSAKYPDLSPLIPVGYFTASRTNTYILNLTGGNTGTLLIHYDAERNRIIWAIQMTSRWPNGGAGGGYNTWCTMARIIDSESGFDIVKEEHKHAKVWEAGVITVYETSGKESKRQIDEYISNFTDITLENFKEKRFEKISLVEPCTYANLRYMGNTNRIDLGRASNLNGYFPEKEKRIVVLSDRNMKMEKFSRKEYIINSSLDSYFKIDTPDEFEISNNNYYILNPLPDYANSLPAIFLNKKQELLNIIQFDNDNGTIMTSVPSSTIFPSREHFIFLNETNFVYTPYEKQVSGTIYERGIIGYNAKTGEQIYRYSQEDYYDRSLLRLNNAAITYSQIPEQYFRLYYYGTCFGFVEFDTSKDISEWNFKIVR